MFKRKDKKFTAAQQEFLREMIASGMDGDQLEVIRQGFQAGFGIDQISVYAQKSIDWKQMTQMYYCLKDGWELQEVAELAKQQLPASRISEMRLEWAYSSPEQREAEASKAQAEQERQRIEEQERIANEQRAALEQRDEENRKQIALAVLMKKKQQERIAAEERQRIKQERIAAEERQRIHLSLPSALSLDLFITTILTHTLSDYNKKTAGPLGMCQ